MNKFLEKASEIHSYFKLLAEDEPNLNWKDAVKASSRWITLLESGENTGDVREFSAFLELESEKHGSGWLDLQCEVRRWLLLKSQVEEE